MVEEKLLIEKLFKIKYNDLMVIPCTKCDNTGRIWPFGKKGEIPLDHQECSDKGFIPVNKFSSVYMLNKNQLMEINAYINIPGL